MNAGITGVTGVPGPETHDEFSYLLAADTFAGGRVRNPGHPLWEHFESFHVLQRPTYQSKYQPGQGLVLALGQGVTGWPIAGAWLAAALACAGIAWALRGVVPGRWALVGGIVAAVHPLVLLWSQNYWGGALAAFGGALVFGAGVRMARRASVELGVVLGVGMLVLWNTRPYEGLVFAMIVATPLLPRVWRPGIIGAVVVVGIGLAWTGYYNWRVTGAAWRLPYLVHEEQYALAPPFLWQAEWPGKVYRNEALREYNEGVELPHFRGQRTAGGFVRGVGEKMVILGRAYGMQPVFAAAVLGLPFALRRRRIRIAAIMLGVFLGAMLLSNWAFPHYAAPALVLAGYLVVQCARVLAAGRRWVLPGLLAASVAVAGWWVVQRARELPVSWGAIRLSLIDDLLGEPGEDLVIVRYHAGRNINTEWVYNLADIDRAPVVFARDLGVAANEPLLRHFAGRKVWVLDVGAGAPTIRPHEGGEG